MRRRIALSLSLIALLLAGAPQQAQGTQLGSLQVSDIQPSETTPLVGKQAITFIFNRRLDCASAAAALRWTPEIPAAVECQDYRLTVTPAEAWQPDTAYTFELGPPLRAEDGAPLLDPVSATFSSAGKLTISEVYPAAESATAPVDSAITVVFDRPVAPLQFSANAEALPQPLTLSPAVAGQGEWVNSAVYVFKPDAPLPGAATIRADVAPLQAADGTKLDSAYSWTFQTAPPSIVSVRPEVGSRDVILDPRIQVQFDQPLPQDLVEQAFAFHAYPAGESPPLGGSFEWAEDGRAFAFSPASRLELDTIYRARFDADLLPNLRFADSSLKPSWTYQTVPAPAIVATEPQNGERDDYPHGITLYFASPMNIETLDGKVSVEPSPESAPLTHYSSWNNSYTVAFDTRPDSEYQVTVAPGMADIYGKAIAEPRLIRFSTAPRPPEVALSNYAPVAFTNARRAPHELAFYHRGVEHVDLALYKLPLLDFVARLTDPDVYDPTHDFRPPEATLLQQWRIPGSESAKSRQQERVTLSESGLSPGIYFAEVSAPGLDLRWENNKRLLNVSSAVLTLKQSADRLTVWALDVSSGATIADEEITVYGKGAAIIGSAKTDARGIAHIDLPAIDRPFSGYAAALDSSEHFGFGFSQWTGGADAWQFGYPLNYYPQAYQTYVYTDRPVYRGGQPVYFRGLARAKDDVTYRISPESSLRAAISDPRGDTVYEEDLTLNDSGSFDSRFDLPADSPPGYYYLTVCLPSGGFDTEECDSLHFQVAEYRLPEYQVLLTAQPPEIAAGETAAILLQGEYYFGGPVSNAAASYQVESAPYAFDYQGDGHYDFGERDLDDLPFDNYGFDENLLAQGELQTDAAGQARFELHGALADGAGSQRWLIEAAVSDESGQSIYSRYPLIVHQGLLYIGARAEEYVSRAGEESRINLIAVDWDSQPIANQPIDIEVVERRWTSTPEQDPITGTVTYAWEVEEIPVSSGSAISDSRGKAEFVYVPPTGGRYQIIAASKDAAGRVVRTTTHHWVASDAYIPWRQESDSSIELVPGKRDYRVGDKAKVLIASPFSGETQALVTIERGGVLRLDLLTLSSNSHIYEFDILPEHAPNVYVTVFLLKRADEQNPAASWRYGMTQLFVDPEQYALDIEIRPDRSSAAPQDTVKYDLHISDHQGAPIMAEVGLGLTDAAALALAERNSQPLLQSFYGAQELGVQTATSLQIANEGSPVALEAAMDMRGFGGGGFAEPGIVDLRDEFIDTPYWNPTLVTDSEGKASVTLRLPDNLTTWRLDARAWTNAQHGELLVGENTHDLQSALPLLIRPQTPRFFIVGDRAQLAAVVNNNTDSPVEASVLIDNLAGLTLADETPQSQHVRVPAGGRARITWLVDVGDVESVAPSFAVRSDDNAHSDASISPVSAEADGALPVYDYTVPETVGTAGTLAEAGTRVEALLLPRDLDLRAGSLDIRLDKSLAGVLTQRLTALEAQVMRHWGCPDSLISRLLANLAAYRALEQLHLQDDTLRSKLDALIAESLPELVERQNDDGGWSWCGAGYSSEMTSAHALLALAQAKGQGYQVDAAVIRRAQRYFQSVFVAPTLAVERWQLSRAAFLDYALAQSGAPDSARSAAIYASRQRLNLDALAFLAQTLQGINPDDRERLDTLAQQLLNGAVTRATGTFFEEPSPDRWNWSSDIRSTALALNALLSLQPDSQLLPNIVRYLASASEGGGHWRSLQETTWSIIALTNWMLHSGELSPSYRYSAAVNGDSLLSNAAMPDIALEADELHVELAQLIPGETNLLEIQRGAGDGALYYSAHLNAGLPVQAVQPLSRGIEISRVYTMPGDETKTPIDSATVGDTVQVRLRIVAPNTLRYVVIEDYFPAGAEAVNPALATSQRIGVMPGGEVVDPQAQGWGWWHFDNIEFRDEKATIYASYLPRGVYEYVYSIRPTAAGDYQVIPPTAQEMHFPEVYGRGAGAVFRIAD